ncbi:hypothetical protein HYH03_014107 [Edaphochlamys debaryana]|uniref:YkgJ family cysteine cluster protein n=1 Tax=Edaphochlamys debaryana TaxID=47281 RepID=A0A835XS58_9CHLO|nr:hypothetical protein HYH03_014107 [Edaphochlamys debaryana]|eukprot:KAG2487266.1 hypothetical protein HYH03_014107 [Edaphochlamys debaryana]
MATANALRLKAAGRAEVGSRPSALPLPPRRRVAVCRVFPSPTPGGGAAGAQSGASASGAAKDYTLEPFRALVQGKRFHCTMCGKCCTGEGEIWMSPDEAVAIARHLRMSLQTFLGNYAKQYSKYKGWRMLKTQPGSSACIFLGEDNKCKIHEVRPSQCSTYPWWPELMLDKEWQWEKENICEGFDHEEAGPLDVEAAAQQLREANKMTQVRLLASTVQMTPQVVQWADKVLVWEEEGGEGSGSEEGGEEPRAGAQR